MRINKKWMLAVMVAAQLSVAGCAAISFFPHQAAEKAADKVLDDFLPGSRAQEATLKPLEPKQP